MARKASLVAGSKFGLVQKQNGHHITCLMSNRVILLKRPYISPNIAPRGSECENNLYKGVHVILKLTDRKGPCVCCNILRNLKKCFYLVTQ